MTTIDQTSLAQAAPDERKKLLGFIPLPMWITRWITSEATPPTSETIQVFTSVGIVDKKLLWIFEMVSSLSVILLAAGLIVSQTNVQTHGEILSNNQWAQDSWAWTQNIAIDTSLLGSIIRAGVYWMEREWRKAILYSALSLVLLFTAYVVSDVEALYQSVQNLSLEMAWTHIPFINVETLTSVRSFAIVLLLIAHAVQYVGWYAARYRVQKAAAQPLAQAAQPANVQPEEDKFDKMLAAFQTMQRDTVQALQVQHEKDLKITAEQITRITVEIIESKFASLPASVQVPLIAQESEDTDLNAIMQPDMQTDEIEAIPAHGKPFSPSSFGEAIAALVAQNPDMKHKDIAQAVGCSVRTVALWKQRMQVQS